MDTGPWIFGRHVLVPAGTIISVDAVNRTVRVGRTKEEIKDSSEYHKVEHTGDADYRNMVDTYYHGRMLWPGPGLGTPGGTSGVVRAVVLRVGRPRSGRGRRPVAARIDAGSGRGAAELLAWLSGRSRGADLLAPGLRAPPGPPSLA